MKVISFFSAKGGTGKTTFNVLLASYIKYRLGKRVMV
ncbi:MAG: ParA family protein, partial [Bacteroidales bacterium]|nr:ParA family protein [Bacteroidales bacterium]